jgi:hypothetical protein
VANALTKIDGGFVWVFGSLTGIPLEQVTIAEAPSPAPVVQTGQSITADPTSQQIDVLLRGNRLQITADVDAAGVAKLKEVLAKYEEILNLLK